ncbi:MAG: DivIVA domain-containing protein [Sciscionella sp.]
MTLTPEDIAAVMFRKPAPGRRGYDEDEVDTFLDRVEAALRGTATVTAQQVADVAFTKAEHGRRGYDEDEVDEFLDTIQRHFGSAPERVPTPRAPQRLDTYRARDAECPRQAGGGSRRWWWQRSKAY